MTYSFFQMNCVTKSGEARRVVFLPVSLSFHGTRSCWVQFFRRVLSLIICTFSTGSYFSGLILFINFQKIEVYEKKKKKKNVYRLLLFCLFRYYIYLIHVHLHYADNFYQNPNALISIRNLLLQVFVWNGNPYTIISYQFTLNYFPFRKHLT